MKLIKNILQLILLPLFIAGGFFLWSLPRITTDYNFNTDELIYLSRSNYAKAYFSGDWNNPIWDKPEVVYDQTQLVNYIYSLVPGDRSLLSAESSPCSVHDPKNFYASWSCVDGQPISSWPSTHNAQRSLVVSGRILATGISSLSVATTYYLGLVVSGPITGILAALYLGWYSFFKNLSTMVMIDQILLVFLNLQFITTLLILKTKKANFLSYLALGIFTGLAVSSKISAAIPTLILYSYLTIASLFQRKFKFSSLLLSSIIALTVFASLHPFLRFNPIEGLVKMLNWRTAQIAAQNSPIYTPTGIVDKLAYSFNELYSSHQVETNLPVSSTFFVLSLISLVTLLITNPHFSLPALLSLATFILIIPIKWNRYLLPIMPALSVVVASFPVLIAPLVIKYRNYLLGGIFALGATFALTTLPTSTMLPLGIVLITVTLSLQGLFITRAMLYNFGKPKMVIPHHQPTLSFSILLPAKNEAKVIKRTLESLNNLSYPKNLYEILVITPADDQETLREINAFKIENPKSNMRLIPIDGASHSKAYSLNLGLSFARNDLITIFDAEDEPSPMILARANDYFLTHPKTHAVQAPVHLTNLTSTWFSALNAVEYYFWFTSVLPYLSTKQTIPLGGNTVFLHKTALKSIGPYDESCLTEDADIGIRLSSAGANIGVLSDGSLATREETPSDELDLIKQRSRWDQGYLQVIGKQSWRRLPQSKQLLTLYILSQPIFRHLSFLNMIFSPLLASLGAIPVAIALFSFIPAYFLIIQLGLYTLGLADLARLHKIKLPPTRYLTTILSFLPYQALLFLATSRALYKIWSGNYHWDKTTHYNAHRPSVAILET